MTLLTEKTNNLPRKTKQQHSEAVSISVLGFDIEKYIQKDLVYKK